MNESVSAESADGKRHQELQQLVVVALAHNRYHSNTQQAAQADYQYAHRGVHPHCKQQITKTGKYTQITEFTEGSMFYLFY